MTDFALLTAPFNPSLIFAPSASNTRRLRQMIVASSSIRCRSVMPARSVFIYQRRQQVIKLGMVFVRQYR
jgi:hypothetical protein